MRAHLPRAQKDLVNEIQILSEIATRAEGPDVAEEMGILSEIARRSEED